jgi:hypothetical protein
MKSMKHTLIILLALLLAGCNLPGGPVQPTPISGMDAVNTAAAQTVVALSTQLAPNPSGAATNTPLPAQNTPVPVATQSPQATLTPLPTAIIIPCDRAKFVADVTIPDDTLMGPGQAFIKTWDLQNDGSCTWTTSYRIVFDSGDAMEGPAAINLPKNVAPGETIRISMILKTPAGVKTYKGYWMLQNANGAKFGLGSTADKPFWVQIKVGVTQAPFAVITVPTTVDPPSYTGDCAAAKTFTFTAKINTSAAGKVTYYWKKSDGTQSDTKTLTFDAAGVQDVSTIWNLGSPGFSYTGWMQIYIDNPNHQVFSKANFSITCNP